MTAGAKALYRIQPIKQERQQMQWQDLAKTAYRAYGYSTNWKNFQGNPMPQWEDLPPAIKVAWEVAVRHTAEVLDTLPSPIMNLEELERSWQTRKLDSSLYNCRELIGQNEMERHQNQETPA